MTTAVSDETPERGEIIKSSIITIVLAVIFLFLAIAFWAWSAPDITSPVKYLDSLNPYIPVVLEIMFMFGFFVFSTVTVVNVKLGLSQIRAGWTEIVIMLILEALLSFLMFGSGVGSASVVLCLAFVVYLYLLQD